MERTLVAHTEESERNAHNITVIRTPGVCVRLCLVPTWAFAISGHLWRVAWGRAAQAQRFCVSV